VEVPNTCWTRQRNVFVAIDVKQLTVIGERQHAVVIGFVEFSRHSFRFVERLGYLLAALAAATILLKRNVTPTVEDRKTAERRVPARMKPGKLPLDDDSLFLMAWHLMWPDYDG
jgi:hypothetical protein